MADHAFDILKGSRNRDWPKVPPCVSNESQTNHWIVWKPFQDGKKLSVVNLSHFLSFYLSRKTALNHIPWVFSIFPPVMCMSTRMPSLIPLQRYLRLSQYSTQSRSSFMIFFQLHFLMFICIVWHLQISKRWKLQSIEQQTKEMEDKKKAKEEAKQCAKKAAGNGLKVSLIFHFVK